MKDKDLMVWGDEKGLMALDADWEFKAVMLMRELIHHNMSIMTEDMHSSIQQQIYNIYMRNCILFDDIPGFDEIMVDVENYNSDIMKRIADMQYEAEGYPQDSNIDPEDAKYEIQKGWEAVHEFNYVDHIDDFVYKILIELNLSFYLPDDYISATLLGDKDLIVLVNDSQAILFPEFLDTPDNSVIHFYRDSTNLRLIGGK